MSTLKELKNLATQRKIKGRSKMNKSQLMAALGVTAVKKPAKKKSRKPAKKKSRKPAKKKSRKPAKKKSRKPRQAPPSGVIKKENLPVGAVRVGADGKQKYIVYEYISSGKKIKKWKKAK